MPLQKYVISAPLFWGFTLELNPANFESSKEIIDTMKRALKEDLLELNLILLCEELDKMELHITDSTAPVVYVCNCKH
jgi:hypothetical protein